MLSHRTTARGILFLILAATLASVAASARAGNQPPKKTAATATAIVFPVVGPVNYIDDFGDPRPGGRHQGIDMMAAKRSLAVAAEAGTVKFWTTSANAGCMLYLYGASGTTYLYIHLNNDLTAGNDNRGKCVAGVAYTKGLKSGAQVEAGQPIGFVGDSGDANGIASHLHFEVHPKDGAAVDPFPYLKQAQKLLFAEPDGTLFTLVLDGTVVKIEDGLLTVKIDRLREWPSHQHQTKVNRSLTIAVPADAVIESKGTAGAESLQVALPLSAALPGQRLSVWTLSAPSTAAARTGTAASVTAKRIVLR
jgi:peptidase M23-like protein